MCEILRLVLIYLQELLQEVEADESENKDEGLVAGKNQRYYSISSKRRHHRHFGRDVGICSGPSGVGVSTTRGGSLQNLHSLTSDIPRARGRRCGLGVRCGLGEGQTLVSARQREGGSLPSNVNVQGRDIDAEMDVLQRAEMICSYTSRATLEVTADRKREETTSNVDLAINFPVSKQVLFFIFYYSLLISCCYDTILNCSSCLTIFCSPIYLTFIVPCYSGALLPTLNLKIL